MLDTTRTAAAAIFAADPTMTPEERKARLADMLQPVVSFDRLLTPKETARLLGRDRHTLAKYARRGLLVAVRSGANSRKATAYTEASVRALLAGNVPTAAVV